DRQTRSTFSSSAPPLPLAMAAPPCRTGHELLVGSADPCDRSRGASSVPAAPTAAVSGGRRPPLARWLGHHGLRSSRSRPSRTVVAPCRPEDSHLFCHVQWLGRSALVGCKSSAASRHGRYS